ncbi:Bpu10I family restriction endonuclease, partial [Salmonella enterica subsp. enterica serovar Hadar]|nr:Bpu10I family restriction endonuclease [Salmonella enterica subsp. enterica serovar Hadar]
MIKNNVFVHGNNILQKLNSKVKYTDRESVLFLEEISRRYEVWKKDNLELKGPFKSSSLEEIQEIICERVKLLNSYKDFLDIQKYAEHFDSRSNLHSSVLEEFMYYLFKDIVEEISPNALIGKSHSF